MLLPAVLLCFVLQDDGAPQESPIGTLIGRIVAENESAHAEPDPYTVVMTHLKGVPRRHSLLHRISRATSMFTDPWSGPRLAADLRDRLLAPFADGKVAIFTSVVPTIEDWLDAPESEFDDEVKGKLAAIDNAWAAVMDESATEAELMIRLSKFCASMNAALEQAFADLSDDEKKFLFEKAQTLLDGWFHVNSPKPDVSEEQVAAIAGMMKVLPRIDRALVLAVARRGMFLADPAFSASFPKRLNKMRLQAKAPDGFSGDILAFAGESDSDRVVLGGPGKTVYAGKAALVLDLAGNDQYDRAAVATTPGALFSAVVDLRGDDLYKGNGEGPCASVGGVAILVDRLGKDSYIGTRLSQAASVGGYAFLFDGEGNDTYTMQDYGQGCGVYGVGVLYDQSGNDKRDAWAFAQGASLWVGFGACVDDTGDDSYLADGHWPDVYGDSGPNSFHGASQGYSTGIRMEQDAKGGVIWGDMPGGVGVLIDRLGKDRYQSGNFSQGGAYFFAFGLMYDGGGDDENFGYRYSQGFGVHEAVGVRWDAGGNDHYVTRCAANLGSAWDEGIGFFLDDQGDDKYEMGSLGLGGAANSAIAIFVDGGGSDTYTGGGLDSQGGAGDRSYYKEPSLSLLLDLGGKPDKYSRMGRKDDLLAADPAISLFLDTQKKSIAELLALPKIAP